MVTFTQKKNEKQQHPSPCVEKGTKASNNVGQARKEIEHVNDYILLPLWTTDPPFSQDPKSYHDDGFKPSSDDGKKVDKDLRKESECNDHEKENNVNSTNNVNTAGNVNTVSSTVNGAGINEVNVVGGKISIKLPFDPKMLALEDDSIFDFSSYDEDDGVVADINNSIILGELTAKEIASIATSSSSGIVSLKCSSSAVSLSSTTFCFFVLSYISSSFAIFSFPFTNSVLKSSNEFTLLNALSNISWIESNSFNFKSLSLYPYMFFSLCGNNSHDGYDCQQQFLFVYEQEPSYNQNFDANHSTQNEESFENSSDEIAVSNPNEEKEEPSQKSDFHQLIEECSTEVSEKQKMKDTMLELVKICQEKEFLCIHDDVDDLIESALNSKLLLINSNSQRLDKKEEEVKNVVEQQAERRNQLEHLLSMGYEHLSITSEIESDEVTESNAENLLPIPSKCEVTLEDKKECDLPISENILVCDNSDIFLDSKIDDDISVNDDDFEDIEYVEASLSDPDIVSVEEGNDVEEENVVQQEEEEIDLEDISQIQDVVLREKLLSITRLISNIESLNDNYTPDRVFNSFESDNSPSDNFSPEFETFCDHSEETRSELLIDDSILSRQSSDSNFEDNPSIPRPPPEPPDAETDAGEEIQVVMNDKDEDVDYSYFMFVIFDKKFSLLSAKSEDTIFDPDISD
nr:hypothetical protein [Tanacetum cinerariifolium]